MPSQHMSVVINDRQYNESNGMVVTIQEHENDRLTWAKVRLRMPVISLIIHLLVARDPHVSFQHRDKLGRC